MPLTKKKFFLTRKKKLYSGYGRSPDSTSSIKAPSRHTPVAYTLLSPCNSSGDCSGFSPDSLLTIVKSTISRLLLILNYAYTSTHKKNSQAKICFFCYTVYIKYKGA